jgi:hypothetical protein
MREFMGSREAILRAGRRGPRPSTGIGSEVPITCAKGSDTSAARVSRLLPAAPEGAKLAACRRPRRRLALLFDFGEKCVETLTPGVSIFGQPGLEQTQKTKSVVHMERRVTLRALVRLMRDRWEQISEAIVYHWGRRITAARVIFYVACSALAASAPQR